MGDRTHVTELRVRYAETDQMGVVYHANYLVWCEIGRTDFIREHGTSYAQMEQGGVLLAVSEANLRLLASAKYDDRVRVETTLSDVRSRQITFDYVLTNAESGVRLATARTTLVSLAKGGGRPASLPPAIRARLAAVVAR